MQGSNSMVRPSQNSLWSSQQVEMPQPIDVMFGGKSQHQSNDVIYSARGASSGINYYQHSINQINTNSLQQHQYQSLVQPSNSGNCGFMSNSNCIQQNQVQNNKKSSKMKPIQMQSMSPKNVKKAVSQKQNNQGHMNNKSQVNSINNIEQQLQLQQQQQQQQMMIGNQMSKKSQKGMCQQQQQQLSGKSYRNKEQQQQQQQFLPAKSKKIQSKSKKANKDKMYLSIDEEEKVPNEHPPKRHSIGINFYQTNYFSQSIENPIHLAKRDGGPNGLYDVEGGSEEEQVNIDGNNRMRIESVSVKRRMPTVIPSNSPGDDYEQNLDKVEFEGRNLQLQPQIMQIQSVIQEANNEESSNNYYTFQQSSSNYNMISREGRDPEEVLDNIGVTDQFGKLNFSPNKRIKKENSILKGNNGMGGINSQYSSVHNVNNNYQAYNELQREVEILRRELQQRDQQMGRINSELIKVKKENQQLKMKLQFENRNNAVLMKNLTRGRQNYFQGNSNNGYSSGIIGSQNNFQSPRIQQNHQFQEQIPLRRNQQPHTPSNQIQERRVAASNRVKNNQQQNILQNNHSINDQQQQQQHLLNARNSLNGNASVASESNQSQNGQLDQPPTQQVHSFQPPTRASQGLRMHQLQMQQQQMRGIGGSSVIHPSQQMNNNLRLSYNQLDRRMQIGQRIRNSINNLGDGAAVGGSGGGGYNEEASLYDSQYNEESILINKVNEMQIKTSRFDQQQQQQLMNSSGLFRNMNYNNEDFIPNEEPLINVREFWGSNLNHNYRLRRNHPVQQNLQGRMNGGQQMQGSQLVPSANSYIHHFHHHHIHHMYQSNPNLQQQQQQQQQSNRGGGVGAAGAQSVVSIRGQGNLHNVFNNSRRVFGLDPQQDSIEERVRGNSQGVAPLRNIFGDCQSCIEDENENIGSSQIRRHMSEDSVGIFEEEEQHHPLPHNHQMFLHNYSFNNPHQMFIGSGGGFSVDDGGMDEYDVADERQHLFEYINPDNMTYEELLALQDRIGFVSKGLSREQINKFPKLKKKDLNKYLNKNSANNEKQAKNQEKKIKSSLSDLELEIKNPLEESKNMKKPNKNENVLGAAYGIGQCPLNNDDECDEIFDDDEGIINRRLPLNSQNHQVLLECGSSSNNHDPLSINPIMNISYELFQERDYQESPLLLQQNQFNSNPNNNINDEGIENCREEDEERKEEELIGSQIVNKQIAKNKQRNNGMNIQKQKRGNITSKLQGEEEYKKLQKQNMNGVVRHQVEQEDEEGEVRIDLKNKLNCFNSKSNDEEEDEEEKFAHNNNSSKNFMQSSQANMSMSSQNKDRCTICFEGINSNDYIKLLPCRHYYHSDCIEQWLMVEKKCPMCMCYLDQHQQQQ